MRSCIFCGGHASSKEDAWPLWLLRRLGASGPGRMEAQRGQAPRSWLLVRAGLKVRSVCSACNNGWMSDLETRAKPVIEPLLDDTTVVLDAARQATIGVWAVKNAMVFDALRSNRRWAFTDQERNCVRQSLLPPTTTTVWIAKVVEHSGAYCSVSDLFADRMQASVTTMAFGPLAVQVARMKLPDTSLRAGIITADMRSGPWDQATIRVWPNWPDPVSWPPSVGLHGDAGIDAFSERWSPNVP
jgi:hypothetical protein